MDYNPLPSGAGLEYGGRIPSAEAKGAFSVD
jgi:hypothetical protein